MKKIICAVILLIAVLQFFPVRVAAVTVAPPNDSRWDNIVAIINTLSSYIRPLAILGFLGITIYGGFTKMTAAGNAEKEKKAMQILQAGIIGFVIIVLAPFVVGIVGAILGIPNILT